jgi:hypothetical protein
MVRITDVEQALARVTDTLASDGYALVVTAADDSVVRIDIRATADACEECLVPQEVLTSILRHKLTEALPASHDSRIDLTYPTTGDAPV